MDLELERSAAICASFFPRNVLDGTIVEIENRIFHGRRKGGVGKPWIVMLVDRGWPLANASPKHGRVEDNREGRRERVKNNAFLNFPSLSPSLSLSLFLSVFRRKGSFRFSNNSLAREK